MGREEVNGRNSRIPVLIDDFDRTEDPSSRRKFDEELAGELFGILLP